MARQCFFDAGTSFASFAPVPWPLQTEHIQAHGENDLTRVFYTDGSLSPTDSSTSSTYLGSSEDWSQIYQIFNSSQGLASPLDSQVFWPSPSQTVTKHGPITSPCPQQTVYSNPDLYYGPGDNSFSFQAQQYESSRTQQSGLCARPQYRPNRRAVLIGIDYFNTRGRQSGNVDATKNMSKFLQQSYGFDPCNIILLTDSQYQLDSQPSKENILKAIHWLAELGQKRDDCGTPQRRGVDEDRIFVMYSGHLGEAKVSQKKKKTLATTKSRGKLKAAVSKDTCEEEMRRIVLFPSDFKVQGNLCVTVVMEILEQTLNAGVKSTFIFDSQG